MSESEQPTRFGQIFPLDETWLARQQPCCTAAGRPHEAPSAASQGPQPGMGPYRNTPGFLKLVPLLPKHSLPERPGAHWNKFLAL